MQVDDSLLTPGWGDRARHLARRGGKGRPAVHGAMCSARAHCSQHSRALTCIKTSMGEALNQAPSTTLMQSAMLRFICVIARRFDSGYAVLFMVFRPLWPPPTLHLGSADLPQPPGITMPRLRLRPRRGSPWHPRRPRTSSSPSGSSPTSALSRRPPAPHAFECLAIIDTTLNSSRRHPSRPGPSSFRHSSPPPAPGEASAKSSHGRTGHGRPSSKMKAPSSNLPRESLTVLHDLVFELREGVDDLQFRVQQMEGRLSVLLQLLASHPEASPEDSSDAPLTASDHASSHQQEAAEGNQQSDWQVFVPALMDTLEQEQTPASKEANVKGEVQLVVAEVIGTSLQAHTSTAGAKMDAHEDSAPKPWTCSGRPAGHRSSRSPGQASCQSMCRITQNLFDLSRGMFPTFTFTLVTSMVAKLSVFSRTDRDSDT
jgi:hypothetical protein